MEEEAWICSERNFYSHALMDCVKAFTGAILVSRRDGVQVHASHFSRPPSLTAAEGGLYSRLLLEDGQDVFFLLVCWFPLRASGAARLGAHVLVAAS